MLVWKQINPTCSLQRWHGQENDLQITNQHDCILIAFVFQMLYSLRTSANSSVKSTVTAVVVSVAVVIVVAVSCQLQHLLFSLFYPAFVFPSRFSLPLQTVHCYPVALPINFYKDCSRKSTQNSSFAEQIGFGTGMHPVLP